MEDYLGCTLLGEMQSSKIIDEVDLFRHRPLQKTRQPSWDLFIHIFIHNLSGETSEKLKE